MQHFDSSSDSSRQQNALAVLWDSILMVGIEQAISSITQQQHKTRNWTRYIAPCAQCLKHSQHKHHKMQEVSIIYGITQIQLHVTEAKLISLLSSVGGWLLVYRTLHALHAEAR